MRTRKKTLIFAIAFILVYVIVDVVYGFVGLYFQQTVQLDSTLTENVFRFSEWLVTTGTAIYCTDKIAGKKNEHNDSDNVDDIVDITDEIDGDKNE